MSATRNSRSTATSDATGMPASALNLFTEIPRRQMALMSQSASALYRGSEAVRKIQQQAAQRASERQEAAAERLREPCDLNEVMAIQTELLRFNLEAAADYWQQLTKTLFKVQAEMVGTVGQVLEPGDEPTLDGLQRAFAATLNGGAATAAAAAH